MHSCTPEQGVKRLFVEGRMGIILGILLSDREGSSIHSCNVERAPTMCRALCSVMRSKDELDSFLPP